MDPWMNANEINAVTHVTDVFVIGVTRARARLTGIPKEPVTCVTRPSPTRPCGPVARQSPAVEGERHD